MNIHNMWEKAIGQTKILRPRISCLKTFKETKLPYVFIAKSAVNKGDAVVRKGEIVVEKPALVLPPNAPFFEGFNFEAENEVNDDILTNFLFVRGINFPSMKYNNKVSSLDIFEGGYEKALTHYRDMLEKKENVDTGLITGPEDCWQFSVLIFISDIVSKSLPNDLRRFFENM